jgi:hypothetical protein
MLMRTLFWRGRGNQFLEARILAQWIKHWIQAEKRNSERPATAGKLLFAARGASYGIESSVSKVEMERSLWPVQAATRARMSRGPGASQRVFVDRNHGDRALRQ